MPRHRGTVCAAFFNTYYMETKRFSKNDSGFVCAHCGRTVEPLGFTSRDHCPFCLWSLHVDVNPGDRANSCGGGMEPISAAPDARKGFVILYRCTRCGALRKNRAAHEATVQPDSWRLLVALTARPFTDTEK